MLAVLVVQVPSAYADEALARQHFKKGIELYDKKNYVEALAAFQEAYREKPSPGIKQNIALSYKALNKYVEAATAFDEALADAVALKPDTRAAIERELAELERVVATVRFNVTTANGKPIEQAVISVEPAGDKAFLLGVEARKRPLRLMPGVYTFTAKATGYPDYAKPRLALEAGTPVDVTFTLGAGASAVTSASGSGLQGSLKIRPSVADAVIRVDGKDVGHGAWEGPLGSGPHRIEVAAPGWKTTTVEVTVPAGGSVDYPITLQAVGDSPPEYTPPSTPREKREKKFYAVPMLALDSVSYRLSDDLGEPPSGVRRSFEGGTISGRFGFFFWKYLSAEGLAAIGEAKNEDRDGVSLKIGHWQLTPALRLTIPRSTTFRFTAATGFGVHGLTVEKKFEGAIPGAPKKGRGVGWSCLIESGLQFDLGPVFLEAAIVVEVHSLPSVRDDASPEDRFLLSSPSVRTGARIGLGVPF